MTTAERLESLENKIDTILSLLQNGYTLGRQTPSNNAPMLWVYMDEWLDTVKAPQIKPKSLAILRSGVDRYIKPQIPDKPLNDVRASEMLNAVEKVPYSYMRQVVYSILRAVFKRAYQYDLIAENPAAKLDFVKHTRQKGRSLTADEQAAFIAAIQDDYTRPLWLFYLLSGCRCQEALTLLWQDIDTEKGRIYIRGTKTENAQRYIPLFPQLSELFATLSHDDEKVFPYTYRAVQCAFYRIRKKGGFTFRIHDLRHTFATRCLESGIAIKTVSKWLGHKHTNTTADIYSHVLTDFERQEVQRFNLKI